VNVQVLLITYGAAALLYHLVHNSWSNPGWLQALAVAVGVAWTVFGSRANQVSRVSIASFVAFALTVSSGPQLLMLEVGSALATCGLVGAKSGRIRLSGRVGPPREYTNAAAYFWSVVLMLWGGGAVAGALLGL